MMKKKKSENCTTLVVLNAMCKIEELPPTSDMKMIDIWLIFCLIVPFAEVILRTSIECTNCSCEICEPKDANEARAEREASSGEVTRVWVATGAKVAPQQVANYIHN